MAKYTKENLQEAVKVSKSISDVARYFKVKPVGGTIGWFGKLIKRFQIDTSHFTGRTHARGKASGNRKSAKELLKNTGKMQHGWKLRRCLLEIGIEHKCSSCGLKSEWNGAKLNLVVDHINGDNTDHRRKNLRFLCPNCHSQTDTFAGKNNKV